MQPLGRVQPHLHRDVGIHVLEAPLTARGLDVVERCEGVKQVFSAVS